MSYFKYYEALEGLDSFDLLLISFCYIDKNFHFKEKEYLIEQGISNDVIKKVEKIILTKEGSVEEIFNFALENLPEDLFEIAAVALVDVAWADGKIDEAEKKYIKLAEKKWNLSIEIISEEWKPTREQKEVIELDPSERSIIEAMPGCGKTQTACSKIATLMNLYEIPSSSILFFSFTNQAIKELEQRIKDLSDDKDYDHQVKIRTIDSESSLILKNFGNLDNNSRSFGNYDENIISSTDLLLDSSRNEDVVSFFENIKHIVLDEAQDIVGIRAQWIRAFIKILPKECGISIFQDPAQALYDTDFKTKEVQQNLLDCLKEDSEIPSFQNYELTKILRTENQNLIRFIEKFHDMASFRVESFSDIDFARMRMEIKDLSSSNIGAFNADEIKNLEEEMMKGLILFRENVEVLDASRLLSEGNNGIRHKLRLANRKAEIKPWIGIIFSSFFEDFISEQEFKEIWHENKENIFLSETDVDICWNDLLENVPHSRAGFADIRKLRQILSSERINTKFTNPDIGHWGPILGTVHGSKGREADNVVYFLSKPNKSLEELDRLQEARVMYVAASRPRDNLHLGESSVNYPRNSLNGSNRRWAYIDRNFHLETGLSQDIEKTSLVDKDIYSDFEYVKNVQNFIKNSIRPDSSPQKLNLVNMIHVDKKDPKYRRYEIRLIDQEENSNIHSLGLMSTFFTREVWNAVNTHKRYKPPPAIGKVFFLGCQTVAISPNDERVSRLHEPFSKSCFWLAPSISGFPMFQDGWGFDL